jgi:hypothetical protein
VAQCLTISIAVSEETMKVVVSVFNDRSAWSSTLGEVTEPAPTGHYPPPRPCRHLIDASTLADANALALDEHRRVCERVARR